MSDTEGKWAVDLGKAASKASREIARLRAREAVYIDACKAAVAYDEAIQSCANDPNKMASFCSAEGHDLDYLYDDWISKSRKALAALDVPDPKEQT